MLLSLLVAGNCLAQAPAVSSFGGGTPFASIDTTNMTAGWSFTANANLIVSALGFWDFDITQPLTMSHNVGLWTSSGTQLATTVVQTNSPLTGSWRYVSITPVNLISGQTYIVGSDIVSPFTDAYTRVPTAGGSVVTSGLITIGTSFISSSASGFVFPGTAEPTFLGRFGPNLIIAQAPPTPPVPISPWALSLIAGGLLAAGLLAIRGRQTAVD